MGASKRFGPAKAFPLMLTVLIFAAGSWVSAQQDNPPAQMMSQGRARSTAPPAKPAWAPPKVTFNNGRVSIAAHDCPLRIILDAVSTEAEIAITLAPNEGDERLTLNLSDLPADEALRRILKNYDAFFFFGADKTRPATLRAVWVYAKGKGQGFAPVPPEMWSSTKELAQRLKDKDPKVRAEAIAALIERKGSEAQGEVLNALEDPDASVRTSALYKSLGAGVQLPAETLQDLALNDPSTDVRILAMQTLEAMNDPSLRAIAEQSLNDPNQFIHDKAEEILQALGGELPGKGSQEQSGSQPDHLHTPPPQL